MSTDTSAPELARRRRPRRDEAAERRADRPGSPARLAAAAARAARAVPAGAQLARSRVVLVENAARLVDPVPGQGGHRHRHPADPASDDLGPLLVDRRAACWSPPWSRPSPATSSWCARAGSARTCCFELRRRVFRHFQDLSPAFHDSYTSGRVISRQTSDIDAIYEMLETGFDGLVTAALTLVGTAVLLLFLDVKLGLVALLLRAVPVAADQLVPQGLGEQLPGDAREGRAGHRALRGVDGRHPRGAGLPPRAAQPGDLRRRQRPVPRGQPGRLPPGRLVHARHQADRQRHHRASCCCTAATWPSRARSPSGCWRRSCSTCGSSSSR